LLDTFANRPQIVSYHWRINPQIAAFAFAVAGVAMEHGHVINAARTALLVQIKATNYGVKIPKRNATHALRTGVDVI